MRAAAKGHAKDSLSGKTGNIFWTHFTKVNLLCGADTQQSSWWCLEQEGMAASLVPQFQSLTPELCKGQRLGSSIVLV